MIAHQIARISRPARLKVPSSAQARAFTHTPKQAEAPRTQYKPATASAPQAPRRNNNQLPVYPIIFIFCLGSASFYFLTKSRAEQGQKGFVVPEKAPADGNWPRQTASDQTLSRR